MGKFVFDTELFFFQFGDYEIIGIGAGVFLYDGVFKGRMLCFQRVDMAHLRQGSILHCWILIMSVPYHTLKSRFSLIGAATPQAPEVT